MLYPKAFRIVDIIKLNKAALYIALIYSAIYSACLFAKSTDKPFFKVSPSVCITETKQKLCEFNIQVNLILAPYKELCLEISNRPQYTQCYTATGVIKERFKLQTTHSIMVQLIDPLTNRIVKEQELSIANYEASDYRIKRRFGWSL
ncbi:DUF3019 domain-containing protein [Pseudoalteromonas shioyasakiensis]|uniref:DUF3019 domain-containing protein n=1 Tax=Pseudoalteromonas shioyasakiensis TaxID=1190813 RepID=UPI002119567C|nr:DUF3019 domain-containing protein [Pseudoalteromonas shioyasakiensis]MCQ8879037.1 DUF3019 domain-containing protein [Pseudoalteromonas shioyasakiensis]